MFKNLFKKNIEPTKNINKNIIECSCDGNNEHCNLIIQLRYHQDFEKKIKNEIYTLENDNHQLVLHFIDFLKKLEENGMSMDYYSWMTNDRNIRIVEKTISECSSADIFRITEELKTYRNKEDVICEKQRVLKVVQNDITEIKSKLGIE